MALTIEGDELNREIATSYIEEKSLGILNSTDSTTIYFQNINQKEIENSSAYLILYSRDVLYMVNVNTASCMCVIT